MSFDATEFLVALFGQDIAPAADDPEAVVSVPIPDGDRVLPPVVADDPADGDLVPWELLPEPAVPCPKCGSIEIWFDLRGDAHCQPCERPILDKALALAARAADLRRKGVRTQKPTRQDRPACVPVGSVDTTVIAAKRPTDGVVGALVACEDR